MAIALLTPAAAYGQAVILESGRHFWAISVPDVEASGLRSFLFEDNSGNTIQLLSTAGKRKS